MHQKSIATLEYSKIVERVASEAAFSASKALALHLLPSPDPDEVRRRLAFTTEARRVMELRPDLGVRGARDVRPHATAAERGAVLGPDDLLEVLVTLRASGHVARAIARLDDSFPLFKALAEDLPTRPQLEGHIAESISDDGAVLDSASPELRRLRAEVRSAQQRLQERLGTLVHEFRAALQEPIITMRADRYVLPVRAEAKGQVRGIVHDQSSSGATVFIEPLVVVEMNNHLRQLHLAEQQEVERILAALSGEVARDAPYVHLAVELLAEIDLHLAKARYASLIRAGVPQINTAGRLHVRQARHPLLTGRVVPIDFALGDAFSMVIITGPNTGGKTVALKTVGLLCLMAQAGMHIPAEDGSELPVYRNVFADIGDEQSIEQSLSTFSSHMSRIIEILHGAAPGCLILLDELGAGTDPSEGSALARAILLHLLRLGVATIATTHYSELKAFAHEENGVANASVEFDVETLSPTYRLQIGLPGRSNALAIATRLGLPEEIIREGRELLGSTGVEMESLLSGLQADRKAAADERYHLSMERAEAEYQRRELERQRAELVEQRHTILSEARRQARREVEEVQAELARIRTEIAHKRVAPERLSALRSQARALEEQVAPLPLPTPASPAAQQEGEEEQDVPEAGPLQVGDAVRVQAMNQQGELLTLPDARGEVEVQLGALKVRVKARDIERLSRRRARAASSGQAPKLITLPDIPPAATPDLQLDLRGRRVEEMLPEVDRYLNDAYLAGMPFVRLLHGKGTGALRQAIRTQLAHHPLVRELASAAANDGGEGVTVVTLVQS
jgi:DNA mismatch repair protein MutS2